MLTTHNSQLPTRMLKMQIERNNMKPEDLGAYYESILEKEVRKEGGVYYTPQYIVDYIVANTVGKLVEN